MKTGDPPAIISCDTSSTSNATSSSSLSTTTSSHLIDRTPQGKTLSLSPTEDSDGKLKLFMEATREIRSKDLLKSPLRPTPSSGKTSAATTPKSGGGGGGNSRGSSRGNSPRPPQEKYDGKRTPGTTRGGKKKLSGAAVTPLPTLPVDAQVTPASLAEQRQRDKFYAYYYHQQYYRSSSSSSSMPPPTLVTTHRTTSTADTGPNTTTVVARRTIKVQPLPRRYPARPRNGPRVAPWAECPIPPSHALLM